jgi:tetratricopeptide (TPR) repeat protein
MKRPALLACLGVSMALWLAGCRFRAAPSYELVFLQATRALAAGRYAEALAAYERAEAEATRLKDRDEAVFQAARMLERLDLAERAIGTYDRLATLSPDGPRAVRAMLDAARLSEKVGRPDALTRLEEVVKRFPNDELSELAIVRLLEHHEATGGPKDRLAYVDALLPSVAAPLRRELLQYERGRALRDLGRYAEAREQWVAQARALPYPHGALSDDALYQAAMVELDLGRPREAIVLLEELLSAREQALAHSYERPRAPSAAYRIARIHRDALHDASAARRAFHKLATDFPVSRFRDDGLWQAAKLEAAGGAVTEACATAQELARVAPESRYVACLRLVCATWDQAPDGCPAYITEGRDEPAID